MHVDSTSYLAVHTFFPLPSALVEPHLFLEDDKQDDSCDQISIRNECEALQGRAMKMDGHQVKLWAKYGCVSKIENNMIGGLLESHIFMF